MRLTRREPTCHSPRITLKNRHGASFGRTWNDPCAGKTGFSTAVTWICGCQYFSKLCFLWDPHPDTRGTNSCRGIVGVGRVKNAPGSHHVGTQTAFRPRARRRFSCTYLSVVRYSGIQTLPRAYPRDTRVASKTYPPLNQDAGTESPVVCCDMDYWFAKRREIYPSDFCGTFTSVRQHWDLGSRLHDMTIAANRLQAWTPSGIRMCVPSISEGDGSLEFTHGNHAIRKGPRRLETRRCVDFLKVQHILDRGLPRTFGRQGVSNAD